MSNRAPTQRICLLVFLLALGIPTVAWATISFAPASYFDVQAVPASVAIGDLNGDEKLDLAVANLFSNSISILLGDGTGSFGPAMNFGVSGNPRSVAIADLNGDGKPDLAVANETSSAASVLIGNGDGTFGAATDYGAGAKPWYVAIADFNGDGKLDVAGSGGSGVAILLGGGTGSFGAPNNFATGAGPISVAIGDLNGDGKLDVAVVDSHSDRVVTLLNTTVFAPTVTIDIKPGSFPNSINPHNPGVIPVAILTTYSFDAATVDPTTVRFGRTRTEAAAVQSALQDVDRDGDLDRILHFSTQATSIVCGNTSASLTGETFGGTAIEGSDSIKTEGCK